jgi:hypothetical protein
LKPLFFGGYGLSSRASPRAPPGAPAGSILISSSFVFFPAVVNFGAADLTI